jgi:hypothetical protein|tara:strand:+ start:67 stop:441 length:375 start_codon:yes stop_codon:yes gene_type:complete
MKYCQGPKCHEYRTKDRIRGSKGDKHYETRKRSEFYYLGGNACSTICQNDWFDKFGELAVNHFGRLHESKRNDASNAWYKESKYNYNGGSDSYSTYYFVNDLLGQRINLSLAQYQDENLTTPPV